MRFVKAIVILDLSLAALGLWAAWFINAKWAYVVCGQLVFSALLFRRVSKSYDNIRRDWIRENK